MLKQNGLQTKKMMENLECGICTELCLQTYFLQCGHQFCKNCIAIWKRKKKVCPVCRVRIVTEVRAYNVDKLIEEYCSTLPEEEQKVRKELIEERSKVPKKKTKTTNRSASQRNRAQLMQAITNLTPEVEFNFNFNIGPVVHRGPSIATAVEPTTAVDLTTSMHLTNAVDLTTALDLTVPPRTVNSTTPMVITGNIDLTTPRAPVRFYNGSNTSIIDLTESPSLH